MIGIARERGIGAHGLDEREAIEPGHHHVAQDERGRIAPDRGQRRHAIADRLDVPALAQEATRCSRACRRCRRRRRCARAWPSSRGAGALRRVGRCRAQRERFLDIGLGAERRGRASAAGPHAVRGEVGLAAREAHRERRADLRPRCSRGLAAMERTSSWISARPMPEPSWRARAGALDRDESARTARGSSFAGMPVPVSLTSSSNASRRCARRTAIGPRT